MTLRDMAMASLSLKAYAAGLIAFMLIKVLAPGFLPSGYENASSHWGYRHGVEYAV